MIPRLKRTAFRALRAASRSTDRYLRAQAQPRLHLGCGGNLLKGWLNTDLYPRSPEVAYLDARRRFPFADGTFDYVYTEHMIEHVGYSEGRYLLAEAFRVLRPGGRIRVATPDLMFLVHLYEDQLSQVQRRYVEWSTGKFSRTAPFPSPTFVTNTFFRNWGHAFIYDEPVLADALARSGFVGVERCRLGDSSDPVLHDLELTGRLPEGFLELETLVLEGVKEPSLIVRS